MIGNLPKKAGCSFKGVVQYITHDKGEKTAYRVTFTETLNLPTQDPERAAQMMAWTDKNSDLLKSRTGQSKAGKKGAGAVYHYTLNWDVSETPDKAEMIRAAKDTLKVLGLEDHEAVLSGHNDKDHPHIHVVANLVHPETGKRARMGMSQRKISAWALEYEQECGQILCKNRSQNKHVRAFMRSAKARDGKYPDNLVWPKGRSKADYHRWKKRQWEIEKIKDRIARQQQWGHQKDLRARLGEELRKDMKEARKHVKETMRPLWAEMYRSQKKQKREFDKQHRHAITRAVYYIRTRKDRPMETRTNLLTGLWRAVFGGKDLREQLLEQHQSQIVQMRNRHDQNADHAILAIKAKYDRLFDHVKERQRQDRERLREQLFEKNKAKITAQEWSRQELEKDRVAQQQQQRKSDEFSKEADPDRTKRFGDLAEARKIEAQREEIKELMQTASQLRSSKSNSQKSQNKTRGTGRKRSRMRKPKPQ